MTSLANFLLPVCLLKSAPCWTSGITGTRDQTASSLPPADHTSSEHVTMTTEQQLLDHLTTPKLVRTYCSGNGHRQSLVDTCRRTGRRRPLGGWNPWPGTRRRSGRGRGYMDLQEKRGRVSCVSWSQARCSITHLTAGRLVAGLAVEAIQTDADEALPLPCHTGAPIAAVVHLTEITCGRRSIFEKSQAKGWNGLCHMSWPAGKQLSSVPRRNQAGPSKAKSGRIISF